MGSHAICLLSPSPFSPARCTSSRAGSSPASGANLWGCTGPVIGISPARSGTSSYCATNARGCTRAYSIGDA